MIFCKLSNMFFVFFVLKYESARDTNSKGKERQYCTTMRRKVHAQATNWKSSRQSSIQYRYRRSAITYATSKCFQNHANRIQAPSDQQKSIHERTQPALWACGCETERRRTIPKLSLLQLTRFKVDSLTALRVLLHKVRVWWQAIMRMNNKPLPCSREFHNRQHIRLQHEKIEPQQLPPVVVAIIIHAILLVPLPTDISPQHLPVLVAQSGEVGKRSPPTGPCGGCARCSRPGLVGFRPHIYDGAVEQTASGYFPCDISDVGKQIDTKKMVF